MKNYRPLILSIALIGLLLVVKQVSYAQDELLELLDEESKPQPVIATFKSTRIINGHSVETRNEGVLQFVIGHRFGRVNTGIENLYGLDDSYIRFGLNYGITDELTAGFGRSSYLKTYDGFLKYKFLKQKTGNGGSPVTITAFANTSVDTQERPQDVEFKHKMSYSAELLIARKFGPGLSLQLNPVWVHRNLVPTPSDDNERFAIGVAGRQKITPSTAFTFEYYYNLNEEGSEEIYNSLGFGVDIETGGHVFQLHITNSRGMVEKDFITNTDGDFWDGDIHIGFNITRVFQIKKEKAP